MTESAHLAIFLVKVALPTVYQNQNVFMRIIEMIFLKVKRLDFSRFHFCSLLTRRAADDI